MKTKAGSKRPNYTSSSTTSYDYSLQDTIIIITLLNYSHHSAALHRSKGVSPVARVLLETATSIDDRR